MAAANEKHPSILKALPKTFNKTLTFSCVLIAISQVNFGFDQAVFTNTQAMPAFTKEFGRFEEDLGIYRIEPYFLSLLNSLNYIGFAFGLISGGLISRQWGRRTSMFVMCGWAIIAAIILATAKHRNQVLAGRIIGYVYIGMELAVVPIFQSEIAPPQVRGFVVGTYQFGLTLGGLIGSLVCRGTSDIVGNNSWKIPFYLLFVIPILILSMVWWIPESPRWYLLKDRQEEGLAALVRLRRGRFSDVEIQQELEDMQVVLKETVEQGSFMELFKGTNLKRTALSVGVNFCLHITGQNFVSVYGAIFLQSLNTVNPFTMTSVNAAIAICLISLTLFLADKFGRVPLMAIGSSIQIIALFIMGGLGTISNPGMTVNRVVTATVTIFMAGFSLGWAPLSHVVAAEIPSSRLRDQTYVLGSAFNIVVQFAISFSIPYLLYEPYAALGSKVGFIFGATAVCTLLFTLLCVPECKGKSLDEIDQLFIQGTPLRKFGKATVVMPELENSDLKVATHEESVVVNGGKD